MAKISDYDNYDTDKSQAEVEKFQETGVLPVSGKYTDNGNMTTKNVKLSDLVGGGSGLPEIGSNDDGKVLTVDTDHAVWAEPSGGTEYQGSAPISITGYSVGNPVVELNYVTDDFDIDQSQTPHRLKLVRPVPSTLAANDGDVLTIDDHAAGSLTWKTPSGGGGGSPYTKATATAGACTPSGKQTSYGFDMYNQPVSINNNTYTIVSNVGYGYNPSWSENTGLPIDNLIITLPQSDFPMAVVEFIIANNGSVVNVQVNNGLTALTRLYATPYLNPVLPSYVDNTTGDGYLKSDTDVQHYHDDYNDYYHYDIKRWDIGSGKPAMLSGYKVQVNIFGGGFTVLTSDYNEEIPAS